MIRKTELIGGGVLALATWMVAGCSAKMKADDVGGLGAQSSDAKAGASNGGSSSGTAGTPPIVLMGGSGGDVGSGATGGTTIVVDPSPGGQSAAGAGGEAGGNDSPEKCDGIDNDGNGIIDDVDVGHDGVCDCLSIGTIGQIGPWGEGDIFAEWLDARTPQGAVKLDDQVLTSKLLAPLQVIVVLHVDTTSITYEGTGVTSDAHHAFTGDEAKAFGDWVKHGGGALTTSGYTSNEASEVANVNLLLGTVGMGYSPTNIDLSGYITDWTDHPVTKGVSNVYTDNGVEPDGENGTTLARDADGRVALQVNETGDGRVIVWGDEWITYDSLWADVENQQVELFWLNMLKWLSPPKTCQVPIPPDIVR